MESPTFSGVPSSYDDLYMTMVFFATLYIVGDILCRRCLRVVPSLVGHIIVGLLFGPEGLNLIRPSPEQWVLLGNLGLLMLIVQAGKKECYLFIVKYVARNNVSLEEVDVFFVLKNMIHARFMNQVKAEELSEEYMTS